jgi:alpha-galactosidase
VTDTLYNSPRLRALLPETPMNSSRPHVAAVSALLLLLAPAGAASAQATAGIAGPTPPANAVWVDALDLGKAIGGRQPRPGLSAFGGRPARGTRPAVPDAPITLGGVVYPHGLGVTANSELWIDLDGKARRFVANAGIDDIRKSGRGSVSFEVWVDGTKRFDSGIVKAGDPAKPVSVDLAGGRQMILYVTDGGDGAMDDYADWGGAAIVMADGSVRPSTVAPPIPAAPVIAASRTRAPRINSPRVTGATPGRPFLFRIPASGAGPLVYAAAGLPAGLHLDPHTGIITGALRSAGRTPVRVTVTGPAGSAKGVLTIVGGEHELALTPPLGWNSWNVWGPTVDDAKVRKAADALVSSGLAAQGYTYVNIDDAWEGPRDASGKITSNEKFPDMKALADYVHSKGLKIGIYSSPGPRTCQQRFAGSWQHEAQDAKSWADWGFDYIKYDWCSYSETLPQQRGMPPLDELQKPYRLMRGILDSLDRDLVFSLCQYGWGDVWTWGADVGGDLWRVTGDISDSWSSMSGIGFAQTGHERYAGPSHWNDTDMLVVGKLGWGSTLRDTHLTPDEQLTHISLWALQAAPLIIGADLSQIDSFTTNLLGNPEILAVDQDPLGKAAGRTLQDGRTEVWARPLADGTMAVGLFNRDLVPRTVTVRWSDLGLAGSQPVRDLWRQTDLGTNRGEYSVVVPRHGVVMVKVGATTGE